MITIDVKYTLFCLFFAALIVLVVYLVILAKNLVKTVKETNKILKDASVISGIAADKAVELDGVIDDVQLAVADISQAVKGQQNLIGAVTNLVKACGSLAAIFHKDAGKDKKKK